MKNRKTLITLGVIVAVLMLGVGYAVISDINLSINGNATATTSDENFKVVFDNSATTVSDDTKVTATVDKGQLTATMTVTGLTTTGDTATATYTIKNNSTELSALVSQDSTKITNDNKTYFDITTNWEETTLAHGGSKTVTVTVKLIKTPATEDQTATFTIPFVAKAQESK